MILYILSDILLIRLESIPQILRYCIYESMYLASFIADHSTIRESIRMIVGVPKTRRDDLYFNLGALESLC